MRRDDCARIKLKKGGVSWKNCFVYNDTMTDSRGGLCYCKLVTNYLVRRGKLADATSRQPSPSTTTIIRQHKRKKYIISLLQSNI